MDMHVFERRRIRLAELLKEISQAELARRSGVAASYISRALKHPYEDGVKNIGELTARKLEKGARKPDGWLDNLGVEASAVKWNLEPSVSKADVRGAILAIGAALARRDDADREIAAIVLKNIALQPDRAAEFADKLESLLGGDSAYRASENQKAA